MSATERSEVFRFGPEEIGPRMRRAASLASGALSRLLSLDKLKDVYLGMPEGLTNREFAREALERLGISWRADADDLARIPAKGPVILTANHPYGGPEGLIMADILLAARPEARIMANHILGRFREMRDMLILVDPFGTAASTGRNIAPLRECAALLKDGGALGVFPAGEVSRPLFSEEGPGVSDPAWNPLIARLARKSGATVVPMYFTGANGLLFHLIGAAHPRLRTALLPRELRNKAGRTLEVRIGAPIPWKRLEKVGENRADADKNADERITDYLRRRTYFLKRRTLKKRLLVPVAAAIRPKHALKPLAEPDAPAALRREIAGLPPKRTLLVSGEFDVICAHAHEIPRVLREIGRLREATFRMVGEGTGKSLDLDRFDEDYLHLFLWDREASEVVGAYRVGRTDKILAKKGAKGLYSSTLFKLRPEFLKRIGPAMEMGRSFVRPERQKSYAPLLLLWKGLARLVALNPKYRTLFGPVSVSNDYREASRSLIADYFVRHCDQPELSGLVKPRAPLRDRAALKKAFRHLVSDMDDVSALLDDLESENKGIPVLMRQYLKLGGKILAFNVDKDFANALDGLIVVDLLQTDRKQLERYMGREETAAFLRFHERALPDCA